MDFTAWFESLKSMTEIVQILGGLGVVTLALAYAKHVAERRSWQRFKQQADDWIVRQVEIKERGTIGPIIRTEGLDSDLPVFHDDVLTLVVEQMLTDSGFSPLQTQQLIGISVLAVKGMAADKFLI